MAKEETVQEEGERGEKQVKQEEEKAEQRGQIEQRWLGNARTQREAKEIEVFWRAVERERGKEESGAEGGEAVHEKRLKKEEEHEEEEEIEQERENAHEAEAEEEEEEEDDDDDDDDDEDDDDDDDDDDNDDEDEDDSGGGKENGEHAWRSLRNRRRLRRRATS